MSIVNVAADHLASMPDIANTQHLKPQGELDWVGMSEIELPLLVSDGDQPPVRVGTRIQAYVNLKDPHAKGIHMSRLYLLLDELAQEGELTIASIRGLLANFLQSHEGLSSNAFVEFRFDYYLRRPSLKSDKSGWKSYPIVLRAANIENRFKLELKADIPYSSTCPCSAALARQLIQENFREQFADGNVSLDAVYEWLGTEAGISATPHSQRSIAEVKVRLAEHLDQFPITQLVDLIEDALKTPVQAAVKREDEQEFARLNGTNPMFCEDAARKIQRQLNAQVQFADFWVRVNHLESLHAHNAVSVVTKGRADGYQPIP